MPLTTYGSSTRRVPCSAGAAEDGLQVAGGPMSPLSALRRCTRPPPTCWASCSMVHPPTSNSNRQQERKGPAHLLGQLLNVVAGGGVVGQAQHARKAVQAVAHSNVDRLAKDAVPAVRVGDDLSSTFGCREGRDVRRSAAGPCTGSPAEAAASSGGCSGRGSSGDSSSGGGGSRSRVGSSVILARTCVLPPDTYRTTGSCAPVTTRPISMCPTQWFTPCGGEGGGGSKGGCSQQRALRLEARRQAPQCCSTCGWPVFVHARAAAPHPCVPALPSTAGAPRWAPATAATACGPPRRR